MAVTFVIGNSNNISGSLFASGNTIASIVALEFPESPAGRLETCLAACAWVHPVRHLVHCPGDITLSAAAEIEGLT